MNLSSWLIDLAAAFNFELKPGLVKQYLKILATWKLNPEQWEELNARALLRNDYFPRISELYQIACEILHEAEVKANSERAETIWQGEDEGNRVQDKQINEPGMLDTP
jgi:hypothetical protein